MYGDCTPGHPVIDEEEEVTDDHAIEVRADAYAATLMTGGVSVPEVPASGFKELAKKAAAIEKALHVDASAVVWAWARKTDNYAMATMAAQVLYRTKGGKTYASRAVRRARRRLIMRRTAIKHCYVVSTVMPNSILAEMIDAFFVMCRAKLCHDQVPIGIWEMCAIKASQRPGGRLNAGTKLKIMLRLQTREYQTRSVRDLRRLLKAVSASPPSVRRDAARHASRPC